MYRDVVATQLGRIPASGRVPLLTRLGDITGASAFGGGTTAAIIVAMVLCGLVAGAFVLSRRRPAPLEWFALGSVAALTAAQLVPAQYYTHYAAVIAPFLSILLAVALARLRLARSPKLSLAIAAGAVALLLIDQVAYVRGQSTPDVQAAVDSVIPPGGCAVSDAPRILVTTDRFVAATRGCTTMADPGGTVLALDSSAEASRVWSAVVHHVDYVVTATPIGAWAVPAAASLYVEQHFTVVRSGSLLIYVRRGRPAGPGQPVAP
jgi:hypothetical protein